jgi:hypothetical protein
VNLAYELVQQFTHMLRTRTGEHLDEWLRRVKASQIRELQSFLTGVKGDKAAVVAGLTLLQNNGVVARTCQQTQADQADDVWQGQISAVTAACPVCFVVPFSS